MDKYISPEMKADFLPSIIKQGTYDGKLFSLGQFDSGLGFYANKAHLERAGVRIPTFEQPWTRAELEAALAKLQQVPGVAHALDLKMEYTTGGTEWFSYGFLPFVLSFGGDVIDRTTYQKSKGVIDSPETVAALTWIQGLFKKGYVDAKPASGNDFPEGKAALVWVGHWMYNDYKKALGEDLLVLPAPNLGQGPKTGAGSWNWGITRDCKNPDLAWKVLEFLVSPDEIVRMTDGNGAPPARKSAFAKSKLYGSDSPLTVYLQQLEHEIAVPRPITPAYPVISEAFGLAVRDVVKGADPQTELDKAAQAIDQDIQDHQGYALKP